MFQSAFTVEYDEDTQEYCVVKWTAVTETTRIGDTVAKYWTEREAQERCEDCNVLAAVEDFDEECEFDRCPSAK